VFCDAVFERYSPVKRSHEATIGGLDEERMHEAMRLQRSHRGQLRPGSNDLASLSTARESFMQPEQFTRRAPTIAARLVAPDRNRRRPRR
jgi:hypothetical protein